MVNLVFIFKFNENIIKLFNNYTFNCECLRGYSNTYKIRWQTKKEYITVETKNNLWLDVCNTIETDKNKYAENTWCSSDGERWPELC